MPSRIYITPAHVQYIYTQLSWCVRYCGGTTQNKRSLLLGNFDPKLHAPAVPRVKPRLKPLFQDQNRQHLHEGEPRDYNTDYLIHLRVAAKSYLLRTMF